MSCKLAIANHDKDDCIRDKKSAGKEAFDSRDIIVQYVNRKLHDWMVGQQA